MSKFEDRSWQIHFAAGVLRQGGVIAYPTETVWGLGCDPSNEDAVRRLLSLKERPEAKGLILITGQRQHVDFLLEELPETLQQRFAKKRGEPTTWLVPDVKDQVPEFVKGRFSSVATRLTDYPIVAELTKCFGGAIVSTSANRAGKAPAANMFKLRQVFGNELDFILPAPLGGFEKPSTIRDLETENIIRA